MWRWTKRILLGLVGLVVVVVGAALILLHTDWGRERARRIAVAQMNDAFAGEASIGKIEGSPFGELVIRDLKIDGPDGKPAIVAAEVHLHLDLWPLIHHELKLEQVVIEQLDLNVQHDKDGQLTFANLMKPGPPSEWTVTLLDTRVHHGHLQYDDSNFDDIQLDGTARIPHHGAMTATIAVSATWREKQAPIDIVATLANDASETTVPALAGHIGDVGIAALAARVVKDPRPIDDILAEAGILPPNCKPGAPGPASLLACLPQPAPPPQIAGLVVGRATREAAASLGVTIPEDVAVAVRVWGHQLAGKGAERHSSDDKTGARATEATLPIAGANDAEDAIAYGMLGRAPVYAYVQGEIATRHTRGFVVGSGLDLGALAKHAGRGSALVAFDLVPPAVVPTKATTRDKLATGTPAAQTATAAKRIVKGEPVSDEAKLPVATAMIAAWGEASGAPPLVIRGALTSDGLRARTLLGVTAPGLFAAIAAVVRIDALGTTLEDAHLVARAPQLGKASGKLPLYGALHADLAAHGTLAPDLALAVSGKADGEHLRYADWHVASLQLTADTKALPHQPFGSARLVLAGVDHDDLHLENLSIAAADRPDQGIDVTIRTRPPKDAWLLDADATVYPGTTTRIALVRHHLRLAGDDWQGTTGDIEIGPRGYSIKNFASASQQGKVALDAALVRGHLTIDARGDGPKLGSARVAVDLDAPTDWTRLRRSAIHSAEISVHAKLAGLIGLVDGVRGQLDVDLHVTPRDATGKIVIAKLSAPQLREIGPFSTTIDIAEAAGKLAVDATARVDGVGGIKLAAKAHVPDRLLAWSRDDFDGATLRLDEIALDPMLFDQLHVKTALRGRLALTADIDPGARAFRFDADAKELRGGTLVRPIDVHVDAAIDAAGTRAGVVVYSSCTSLRDAARSGKAGPCAKTDTLLEGHADLPITAAELLGDRTKLLAKKLTGTVTLPSAPVNRLLDTFGRSDITRGTLDGTITLAGTIGKPTAVAKLAAHDLAVPQGQNVRLLELDASWDGATGKLALVGHEDGGGELKLTASGSPAALDKATALLEATHFDLRPVAVFIPGPAGAVSGRLDGKLAITGIDPRTAEIAGTLALRDGRLPIAPAVGTLRQATIDLEVKDRRVKLAADGTLGKGKITVRGEAPLTGESGNATITLRKVRPIGSVEPTIDADITADIKRTSDRWEANVKVANGLVQIPDDKGHPLDPVGPPEDFSYGTAPRRKELRSKLATLPPPVTPYLVCRVEITSMRVESKEVRSVLDGKLRITLGPASAGRSPIGIVGDVSAQRGDLDLFGRRYQLDHASAHFDGSIDPLLDARIQYDFPSVTTDTVVRGRASKPELVLSSQPGIYSQAELLGFLLGGEPNGDPQQGQSATQRVESAGTSYVANYLGGYVKDALPAKVDVLKYEAATADKGSAIMVGTWLTHELFLAYRQHLESRPDENTGEGEVEYWLTKRTSVQATAGDRSYDGVDLLWRKRW